MADVRKSLPEKGALIDAAVTKYQQAFTACGPAIDFASKTTSAEENMKAAARLKAECRPGVRKALANAQKMVDDLVAGAAKTSDELSTQVNLTIRMIWIFSGLGLVAGFAAAMWTEPRGWRGQSVC